MTVINRSMIALAGSFAERIYTGIKTIPVAGHDLDVYPAWLHDLFADSNDRKLFDCWIRCRTELLVEAHWWRVEAIAKALFERSRPSGNEMRPI